MEDRADGLAVMKSGIIGSVGCFFFEKSVSLVRALYGYVGACPCCKEWVWHEVQGGGGGGGEKFDCEPMVLIDSQICAACSSMLHSDDRYSLTK